MVLRTPSMPTNYLVRAHLISYGYSNNDAVRHGDAAQRMRGAAVKNLRGVAFPHAYAAGVNNS